MQEGKHFTFDYASKMCFKPEYCLDTEPIVLDFWLEHCKVFTHISGGRLGGLMSIDSVTFRYTRRAVGKAILTALLAHSRLQCRAVFDEMILYSSITGRTFRVQTLAGFRLVVVGLNALCVGYLAESCLHRGGSKVLIQ